MDTYCHRCGEPIDIEEFHEVAAEIGSTFAVVLAEFQARGCIAIAGVRCAIRPSIRNEAVAMLNDILGDDIDGIASMMEDFDYAGLLED